MTVTPHDCGTLGYPKRAVLSDILDLQTEVEILKCRVRRLEAQKNPASYVLAHESEISHEMEGG